MLLKNEESVIDFTLLELWEEQLVEAGVFIFSRRREFIEEFTPIFNQFYSRISQSGEQVSFSYISQLNGADFLEKLKHNRQRDLYLGHTSVGIHRDELEMLLDDYPIKKVGSQGQNKTYFVSLKLAQFHFLLKRGNTTPIILLDDIFDRLDSKRVEEIVKLVSGEEFGQIFISDTNRGSLDKILARLNNNSHIYSVTDGEITLIKD